MVGFCYDCAVTQDITAGIPDGDDTMSGHPNQVQALTDLRGADQSLQSSKQFGVQASRPSERLTENKGGG